MNCHANIRRGSPRSDSVEKSAGTTTYAYDLADRLISASTGTTTETYTWTGDGIRRSAATGAQAVSREGVGAGR